MAAFRVRENPGIPKAPHRTTPHLTSPRPRSHPHPHLVTTACNGRDGDKSGAAAGESRALVNRVAGPFMSSASSSSGGGGNDSTGRSARQRARAYTPEKSFSRRVFYGRSGLQRRKEERGRGVGGGGGGGDVEGGGERFTCDYYGSSYDSLSLSLSLPPPSVCLSMCTTAR